VQIQKPPETFRQPAREGVRNAKMTAMTDLFHPAVAAWFRQQFPAPTPAQARAWPAIRAGRNVLIAAPTGSGKTLAAFLATIDALVREGFGKGCRTRRRSSTSRRSRRSPTTSGRTLPCRSRAFAASSRLRA
jgi:superfamily II DNA/RNA helicase